ncbi:MAG: nuclear transport factor 2 family protein [Proteobacteria bacterium]|nr:nuclear transport factor 2 family protein [Pseudomonadota bacterium]
MAIIWRTDAAVIPASRGFSAPRAGLGVDGKLKYGFYDDYRQALTCMHEDVIWEGDGVVPGARGRVDVRGMLEGLLSIFPDAHYTLDAYAESGDQLAWASPARRKVHSWALSPPERRIKGWESRSRPFLRQWC